jgi:hypothetical protein
VSGPGVQSSDVEVSPDALRVLTEGRRPLTRASRASAVTATTLEPLAPKLPGTGPNARVNDPTGDATNETQEQSGVATWGRFVVSVWADSKGLEPPLSEPPFARVGFAVSCDWGTTFADGGSIPRGASNSQTSFPSVTSDGRGNFYVAAILTHDLSPTGVPAAVALGFWKGSLDSTNCTITWQGPTLVESMPVGVGLPSLRRVRVVADPYDDHVYLVYTYIPVGAFNQVRVVRSADAGQSWSTPTVLSGSAIPSASAVNLPDAAVGPNHALHVVWGHSTIWIQCNLAFPDPVFISNNGTNVFENHSTDHGVSWAGERIIAPIRSTFHSAGPAESFGRHKGNPRIAVDRSGGPDHGRVYVVWTASAMWNSPSSLGSSVAELEPNDTPIGAATVPLGADGAGVSTDQNDIDFWRVDLAAGDVLLARVAAADYLFCTGGALGAHGYSLDLITNPSDPSANPADSLLQSSAIAGSSFPSQVVFTCKRTGTYYLRVDPTDLSSNQNYVLNVRKINFTTDAYTGRDEGDIVIASSFNGGNSWSTPVVVNSDAPPGYQETGHSVTVDDQGRVVVGWLDHRESEAAGSLAHQGQFTDAYVGVSTNGGVSFGPGERLSDERSLFGPNLRVADIIVGRRTHVTAEGNHWMAVWDAMPVSTRDASSTDVWSQFADRELPAVAITVAPPDSSSVPSGNVHFEWLGSDRRSPPNALTYTRSLQRLSDGTYVFQDVTGSETSLELSTALLPADGMYELSVRSQDEAGNLSGTPATRRFVLDTTAPGVTILSGPDPGAFTNGDVTFRWTATDASPGAILYSYRLDNGEWSEFFTTIEASFTSLAAGPHVFEIRAQDVLGNVGTRSCPFDARDLVSLWPADGTTTDVRGGQDVQLVSGLEFAQGIASMAFDIEASARRNAFVLAPHATAHDPGTSSFTVSAWVYPTNILNQPMSILSKNEPGDPQPTSYELYQWNSELRFFIRDDDAGGDFGGGQLVFGSHASLLTPGRWHHVAATRDQAAGRLRLYLDGVVLADVATNAGASGPMTFVTGTPEHRGLTFGIRHLDSPPGAVANLWVGRIDEPAYYQRSLVETEILGLYASRTLNSTCDDDSPRSFSVDLAPPVTALGDALPEGGHTNADPVVIAFSGTDDLAASSQIRFSWRVDGNPFTPLSDSTTASLAGLDEGEHLFEVYAVDLVGNADLTPAQLHFTVDRTPPSTALESGPSDGAIVTSNSATYGWSGLDDRSPADSLRFQYALDAGLFSLPTPEIQHTFTSLADGAHSVHVRALDRAGNLDTSPETRALVVDAQGPVASFTEAPPANACIASGATTVRWTANDVVSPRSALQFAWSLDGGPATAFAPDTVADLQNLPNGVHTITVQAVDERGHVTSIARTFRVDLVAPFAFAPAAQVLDENRVRFSCTGTDNSGVTGFHLQISTDPAFLTVLQEADLPAAGVFDFTGSPGNTYYGRARAQDCAGNVGAYSATSNNGTLVDLANLLVSIVNPPPTAVANTAMSIEFTIANNALGATNVPEWSDDVFLSPTPTFDAGTAVFLGRVQNLTYLANGETYTIRRDFVVPVGLQGTWYVVVVADALGQVPETQAGDNVGASSAVAVSLGALADLRVTQVTPPPTALSGNTATVVWTVKNIGTGRTHTDRWFDTVFFSSDATMNYELVGSGSLRVLDAPLGSFEHVGALDPGQEYTVTAQVQVPANAQGPNWFLLASDLRASSQNEVVPEDGLVFEHLDELNFGAGDSTDVTLLPPPDLVAMQVAPASGQPPLASGGLLTVEWSVRNGGFSNAPSHGWTDRVWLSVDAVLDPGDIQLGLFGRVGGLPLGETYSMRQMVTIPNGISGPHRLILETDAFQEIGEFSEANNTSTAAGTLAIQLSPWPDLAPLSGTAPDTVGAGQSAPIGWTVTNASLQQQAVSGSWRDDVYLSPSPTWNPGAATQVAGLRTTQSLLPGQGYARTATVNLPTSFAGLYHVYVKTDAQEEVFEHVDEGNNLELVTSLYVKPYPTVDLAASGVQSSAAAASTGDALEVTWSLANIGQGATLSNSWAEQVWLSTDAVLSPATDILMQTPTHGGTMLAGSAASGSATLLVPPGLEGTFHVLVRTDPFSVTGDASPANNVASSAGSVVITDVPQVHPDLTVTDVAAPASGTAGQPFPVIGHFQNLGPNAMPARTWYASAYLSVDSRLDGSDLPLGTVAGPASLAAPDTVSRPLQLELPNYASGAYFLIVQADPRNEIHESIEGNNTFTRPVVVVLPPPADLIVEDVSFTSPSATPGEPVTVNYLLRNVGANPAVGQLQNGVYLSADTEFDSAVDPLVGLETLNIALAPGAAQRLKQVVSLTPLPLASLPAGITNVTPPLTPGPYHGVVRANVRAAIRESDAENNQHVSAGTVQGEIAALTLNVAEPFTLTNGQQQFYRVAVPEGMDLRFTTTSDVDEATNELFVSHGHTPTGADFDFSGPAGFTAEPSVLVPGTHAGEYFVLVTARSLGSVAAVENLTITAQLLPFGLASHEPAAGGQGREVTARIRGAGLRDFTEFRLETEGLPVATARLLKFVNSTEVLVRWDLEGVGLGLYEVVAAHGTDEVVLPGAFTVEEARPMTVAIEVERADVLRRNAIAPFTFLFRNTSNQDVPALRARLVFPSSSSLRALVTGPGLLTRSARSPGLFEPLAGDAYLVRQPSTGDSLTVVELVGANLSPGEARSVTLSVSGFATSPYSVLAMAEGSERDAFLEREASLAERSRHAVLMTAQALPVELTALATDIRAFRQAYFESAVLTPGLATEEEVAAFLATLAVDLPPDTLDRGPDGPEPLLAEALAGDCAVPGAVPDCTPEVAPVESAMPGCRVVFDTPVPVALPMAGGGVVNVASALTKGYSQSGGAHSKIVAPCDPNQITGPSGFGNERWWSVGEVMNYRVDFENLPADINAPATPAQVVEVVVPLDADIDLTSFRLANAGFGGAAGHVIPVGPVTAFDNGGVFYSDLGLYVQYTAGIDVATRVARFRFSTLGPNRQPPTNPFVGFLPVNDQTGRGQGFVTFSVKPLGTVATGTEVALQASIKFDANAPVPTNVATNLVDSELPSSSVSANIEVLDASHLRIHWTGQDEAGGSGLQAYSVHMRRDTEAYQEVGSQLTSNSMELTVEQGHRYSFLTRARDNTGNLELDAGVPDQQVDVGIVPPLGTGDPRLPRVTTLMQNAPNPWRSSTLIRFDLASESEVTLEVFDIQGRVVAQPLLRKRMPAGNHSVSVDRLAGGAGVYFYRMQAKSYQRTLRMVHVR